MQRTYIDTSVGMSRIDRKLNEFTNKCANTKNEAKVKVYEDCINKLELAKSRMTMLKSELRKNITKHRTNIEILKAKLQCIESLKSVNSYLKDININNDDGIQSIVDDTLELESATFEALNDMAEVNKAVE